MNPYLIKACQMVLMPVVRLLLKNGVTYKAFMAIAKKVYVDVASQDYGIDGRPTNTNRVAILTGLDRKTIKQLKEQPDSAFNFGTRMMGDRITRVLTGWYTDPDFLGREGKPRSLSFDEASPNLETLLLRHGGDIQPTALLKELKRVGVVEEQAEGHWQAIKRSYINSNADPEFVMRSFSAMGDLGHDIYHNLYIADEKIPKYFERRATSPSIPKELAHEFHDFLNREGQRFLEEVDAWLTKNEINPEENQGETLRLGLGMYCIEHSESGSKKTINKKTRSGKRSSEGDAK